MPRSVPHNFDGDLSDIQLRVWERRSERSLHAIVEGQVAHRCASSTDHPVEVYSRWDIPEGATPWHELALRARDGDRDAARELAESVVEEAIHNEWLDPCDGRASQ